MVRYLSPRFIQALQKLILQHCVMSVYNLGIVFFEDIFAFVFQMTTSKDYS